MWWPPVYIAALIFLGADLVLNVNTSEDCGQGCKLIHVGRFIYNRFEQETEHTGQKRNLLPSLEPPENGIATKKSSLSGANEKHAGTEIQKNNKPTSPQKQKNKTVKKKQHAKVLSKHSSKASKQTSKASEHAIKTSKDAKNVAKKYKHANGKKQKKDKHAEDKKQKKAAKKATTVANPQKDASNVNTVKKHHRKLKSKTSKHGAVTTKANKHLNSIVSSAAPKGANRNSNSMVDSKSTATPKGANDKVAPEKHHVKNLLNNIGKRLNLINKLESKLKSVYKNNNTDTKTPPKAVAKKQTKQKHQKIMVLISKNGNMISLNRFKRLQSKGLVKGITPVYVRDGEGRVLFAVPVAKKLKNKSYMLSRKLIMVTNDMVKHFLDQYNLDLPKVNVKDANIRKIKPLPSSLPSIKNARIKKLTSKLKSAHKQPKVKPAIKKIKYHPTPVTDQDPVKKTVTEVQLGNSTFMISDGMPNLEQRAKSFEKKTINASASLDDIKKSEMGTPDSESTQDMAVVREMEDDEEESPSTTKNTEKDGEDEEDEDKILRMEAYYKEHNNTKIVDDELSLNKLQTNSKEDNSEGNSTAIFGGSKVEFSGNTSNETSTNITNKKEFSHNTTNSLNVSSSEENSFLGEKPKELHNYYDNDPDENPKKVFESHNDTSNERPKEIKGYYDNDDEEMYNELHGSNDNSSEKKNKELHGYHNNNSDEKAKELQGYYDSDDEEMSKELHGSPDNNSDEKPKKLHDSHDNNKEEEEPKAVLNNTTKDESNDSGKLKQLDEVFFGAGSKDAKENKAANTPDDKKINEGFILEENEKNSDGVISRQSEHNQKSESRDLSDYNPIKVYNEWQENKRKKKEEEERKEKDEYKVQVEEESRQTKPGTLKYEQHQCKPPGCKNPYNLEITDTSTNSENKQQEQNTYNGQTQPADDDDQQNTAYNANYPAPVFKFGSHSPSLATPTEYQYPVGGLQVPIKPGDAVLQPCCFEDNKNHETQIADQFVQTLPSIEKASESTNLNPFVQSEEFGSSLQQQQQRQQQQQPTTNGDQLSYAFPNENTNSVSQNVDATPSNTDQLPSTPQTNEVNLQQQQQNVDVAPPTDSNPLVGVPVNNQISTNENIESNTVVPAYRQTENENLQSLHQAEPTNYMLPAYQIQQQNALTSDNLQNGFVNTAAESRPQNINQPQQSLLQGTEYSSNTPSGFSEYPVSTSYQAGVQQNTPAVQSDSRKSAAEGLVTNPDTSKAFRYPIQTYTDNASPLVKSTSHIKTPKPLSKPLPKPLAKNKPTTNMPKKALKVNNPTNSSMMKLQPRLKGFRAPSPFLKLIENKKLEPSNKIIKSQSKKPTTQKKITSKKGKGQMAYLKELASILKESKELSNTLQKQANDYIGAQPSSLKQNTVQTLETKNKLPVPVVSKYVNQPTVKVDRDNSPVPSSLTRFENILSHIKEENTQIAKLQPSQTYSYQENRYPASMYPSPNVQYVSSYYQQPQPTPQPFYESNPSVSSTEGYYLQSAKTSGYNTMTEANPSAPLLSNQVVLDKLPTTQSFKSTDAQTGTPVITDSETVSVSNDVYAALSNMAKSQAAQGGANQEQPAAQASLIPETTNGVSTMSPTPSLFAAQGSARQEQPTPQASLIPETTNGVSAMSPTPSPLVENPQTYQSSYATQQTPHSVKTPYTAASNALSYYGDPLVKEQTAPQPSALVSEPQNITEATNSAPINVAGVTVNTPVTTVVANPQLAATSEVVTAIPAAATGQSNVNIESADEEPNGNYPRPMFPWTFPAKQGNVISPKQEKFAKIKMETQKLNLRKPAKMTDIHHLQEAKPMPEGRIQPEKFKIVYNIAGSRKSPITRKTIGKNYFANNGISDAANQYKAMSFLSSFMKHISSITHDPKFWKEQDERVPALGSKRDIVLGPVVEEIERESQHGNLGTLIGRIFDDDDGDDGDDGDDKTGHHINTPTKKADEEVTGTVRSFTNEGQQYDEPLESGIITMLQTDEDEKVVLQSDSDIPMFMKETKIANDEINDFVQANSAPAPLGRITPPVNGRNLVATEIEIKPNTPKPTVNEQTLKSNIGDVLFGRVSPIHEDKLGTNRRDGFPTFPEFEGANRQTAEHVDASEEPESSSLKEIEKPIIPPEMIIQPLGLPYQVVSPEPKAPNFLQPVAEEEGPEGEEESEVEGPDYVPSPQAEAPETEGPSYQAPQPLEVPINQPLETHIAEPLEPIPVDQLSTRFVSPISEASEQTQPQPFLPPVLADVQPSPDEYQKTVVQPVQNTYNVPDDKSDLNSIKSSEIDNDEMTKALMFNAPKEVATAYKENQMLQQLSRQNKGMEDNGLPNMFKAANGETNGDTRSSGTSTPHEIQFKEMSNTTSNLFPTETTVKPMDNIQSSKLGVDSKPIVSPTNTAGSFIPKPIESPYDSNSFKNVTDPAEQGLAKSYVQNKTLSFKTDSPALIHTTPTNATATVNNKKEDVYLTKALKAVVAALLSENATARSAEKIAPTVINTEESKLKNDSMPTADLAKSNETAQLAVTQHNYPATVIIPNVDSHVNNVTEPSIQGTSATATNQSAALPETDSHIDDAAKTYINQGAVIIPRLNTSASNGVTLVNNHPEILDGSNNKNDSLLVNANATNSAINSPQKLQLLDEFITNTTLEALKTNISTEALQVNETVTGVTPYKNKIYEDNETSSLASGNRTMDSDVNNTGFAAYKNTTLAVLTPVAPATTIQIVSNETLKNASKSSSIIRPISSPIKEQNNKLGDSDAAPASASTTDDKLTNLVFEAQLVDPAGMDTLLTSKSENINKERSSLITQPDTDTLPTVKSTETALAKNILTSINNDIISLHKASNLLSKKNRTEPEATISPDPIDEDSLPKVSSNADNSIQRALPITDMSLQKPMFNAKATFEPNSSVRDKISLQTTPINEDSITKTSTVVESFLQKAAPTTTISLLSMSNAKETIKRNNNSLLQTAPTVESFLKQLSPVSNNLILKSVPKVEDDDVVILNGNNVFKVNDKSKETAVKKSLDKDDENQLNVNVYINGKGKNNRDRYTTGNPNRVMLFMNKTTEGLANREAKNSSNATFTLHKVSLLMTDDSNERSKKSDTTRRVTIRSTISKYVPNHLEYGEEEKQNKSANLNDDMKKLTAAENTKSMLKTKLKEAIAVAELGSTTSALGIKKARLIEAKHLFETMKKHQHADALLKKKVGMLHMLNELSSQKMTDVVAKFNKYKDQLMEITKQSEEENARSRNKTTNSNQDSDSMDAVTAQEEKSMVDPSETTNVITENNDSVTYEIVDKEPLATGRGFIKPEIRAGKQNVQHKDEKINSSYDSVKKNVEGDSSGSEKVSPITYDEEESVKSGENKEKSYKEELKSLLKEEEEIDKKKVEKDDENQETNVSSLNENKQKESKNKGSSSKDKNEGAVDDEEKSPTYDRNASSFKEDPLKNVDQDKDTEQNLKEDNKLLLTDDDEAIDKNKNNLDDDKESRKEDKNIAEKDTEKDNRKTSEDDRPAIVEKEDENAVDKNTEKEKEAKNKLFDKKSENEEESRKKTDLEEKEDKSAAANNSDKKEERKDDETRINEDKQIVDKEKDKEIVKVSKDDKTSLFKEENKPVVDKDTKKETLSKIDEISLLKEEDKQVVDKDNYRKKLSKNDETSMLKDEDKEALDKVTEKEKVSKEDTKLPDKDEDQKALEKDTEKEKVPKEDTKLPDKGEDQKALEKDTEKEKVPKEDTKLPDKGEDQKALAKDTGKGNVFKDSESSQLNEENKKVSGEDTKKENESKNDDMTLLKEDHKRPSSEDDKENKNGKKPNLLKEHFVNTTSKFTKKLNETKHKKSVMKLKSRHKAEPVVVDPYSELGDTDSRGVVSDGNGNYAESHDPVAVPMNGSMSSGKTKKNRIWSAKRKLPRTIRTSSKRKHLHNKKEKYVTMNKIKKMQNKKSMKKLKKHY